MKVEKLGSYIEILSGFAFKSGLFNEEGIGLPLIRVRDVNSGFSGMYYSGDYSKEYVIYNGDILIGMDGDFNAKVWKDGTALLNQRVCKLVVDEEKLNKNYMLHYLNIELKNIQRKTTFTTVKHLSAKSIEAIRIPLPSPSDQFRIANVLNQAKMLIANRKESIKALDELLESTFLEMFGDPVKNAMGWNRDNLKNLCEFITKGTTPKGNDIFKIFNKELVPFIKVYHISKDGSINFNYNPSFISQTTHKEYLRRSIVYPNDILMNIVGPPLGKIGLVPNTFQEWNVNQAIAIFRCGVSLDPRYLLFTLKSRNFCDSIIKMAVGVRQLNLSLEQCREINIPVPPLQLQNQFAAVVEKVEAIKTKYIQSLANLEDLYVSLSQRAFKGELDLRKIIVQKKNETSEMYEFGERLPPTISKPIEAINYFEATLEELIKSKAGKTFSIDSLMTELEKVNFDEMPKYEELKEQIYNMLKGSKLTQILCEVVSDSGKVEKKIMLRANL